MHFLHDFFLNFKKKHLSFLKYYKSSIIKKKVQTMNMFFSGNFTFCIGIFEIYISKWDYYYHFKLVTSF